MRPRWRWEVAGWVHGRRVASGSTRWRWQAHREAAKAVSRWPRTAVLNDGPAAIVPRPTVTIERAA